MISGPRETIYHVWGNRALALCGILAPLIFVGSMYSAAIIQPGPAYTVELLSALTPFAHDPYSALVSIGGFIVPGLLAVAFTIGVRNHLDEGRTAGLGAFLIALVGLGMLGIGLLPTPAAPDIPEPVGLHWLHMSFVLLIGFGGGLAPLVLGTVFRRMGGWRGLGFPSLAAGVVATLCFAALVGGYLRSWEGVLVELFVGALFIWTEAVAVRVLVLVRENARQERDRSFVPPPWRPQSW